MIGQLLSTALPSLVSSAFVRLLEKVISHGGDEARFRSAPLGADGKPPTEAVDLWLPCNPGFPSPSEGDPLDHTTCLTPVPVPHAVPRAGGGGEGEAMANETQALSLEFPSARAQK